MGILQEYADEARVEKPDGTIYGPYKASFPGKTIFILDENADVEEGDVVLRVLPNGKDERSVVSEVTFYKKGVEGVGAHYQIKYTKGGQIELPRLAATGTIGYPGAYSSEYESAGTQQSKGDIESTVQGGQTSEVATKDSTELSRPALGNQIIQRTNKTIVLTTASVLQQVDEYLDSIKKNNLVCVEHPEHIQLVEELKENLEQFIEHTPISDDAKPIEEVEEAESRWRNIARLIAQDFSDRTSDEAVAERALPIGVVLGCGGIGLLLGGPLGFGAGALAGKFIIGEKKSGAVADKIEEALDNDGS